MPVRLKSLELQGYKTFASRTIFEFAGMVTAIVGPNGSGKSNLSDALRWVLGEQSFSLLRAKKTEDLIFSGSEQRPRASMASATIVFDNSENWLPIDYSEVSITRRAYRDGENEYLLNGQRVRLRDVSELLAQSGLAERTYTIIGQGLVDAALALKAEERRRLFEEAAGIGLHRSRREEALRRLEATRRNLERVQDILAEIQPRLRSLERQARRAQEYEQVKADLRLVLREWYGFHWHRAQKELAEAREATRGRESVLERARQAAAELSQRQAAAGEGIHELRTQLSAWHRQSAQLHTRREVLSRELAVSEERARSLGEQGRSLEAELRRLEEERGLSQQKLEAATGEAAQLQIELEEAQAQAGDARRALIERQAERSQVEKAGQAALQVLSTLTARQAHFQARLGERRANLGRQKEAWQAGAAAHAGDEAGLRSAGQDLAEAARLWQEGRAAREAAAGRLGDVRRRLGELDAERKETLERRAALEAGAARLRAEVEVLEGAERNLAGYSSGARLLIEAGRASRLDGVRGALSGFLEIPAELETAIAAALGEFVEAVLLEAGPGEALDYLRAHSERASELADGAARAALLPLASILQHSADSDALTRPAWADLEMAAESGGGRTEFARDGVLGVAANLVSAPAELRPAVEAVLGTVWIVKDRPTALRVLAWFRQAETRLRSGEDPLPASPLRLATLQGEVFFASGPVLAPAAGRSGSAPQSGSATLSILSRPRQLRELQARQAGLERQGDGLTEEIRRLEGARSQMLGEESRLAQELKTTQAEEERLRTAQRESDLAVEKARRQLQWRGEQVARLVAEMEQGAAEIDDLAAQLAQLEGEIDEARKTLHEWNARLASLSLEELQTRLAHWSTRAAVAERALAEAARRRQERQAAMQAAAHAREAMQARLAELGSTRQVLEAEKDLHRQEERQVSQAIETLRQQIEPAEARLEASESDQAQILAAEATARQSLSLAEHQHAQARILLARRQEALDSLQRRVEDDFGLVAFQYAEEISGQAPLPLDGMVEQLPTVAFRQAETMELPAEIEESIKRQRAQLRRMGPVNPEAQAEWEQVRERYDFLTAQVTDLTQAEADIREVIAELDGLMEREFRKTFDAVAEEFHAIFSRLFGGGSARLLLTDPEDLTGTGIEIEARLPGRRTQGLALLSGGERSLAATALVFALLKVSPTPFCVLDEVDAMLDEANVGRFRDLLRELSQNTQFVVVTHNRNTVQVADVLYGVTMGRDSASQVLSLKLDEAEFR